MTIAFALDAHDDTLTTIVDTTLDTDLVAYVQADLLRLEIGDVLLIVFCDSDEVLHNLGGDSEVFPIVGEGGALEVDDVMGVGDVVLYLFEGTLDKDVSGEDGDQKALFVATNLFDFVFEGYEGTEAITTGIVADFEFATGGGAGKGVPELFGRFCFAHRELFKCHTDDPSANSWTARMRAWGLPMSYIRP